MTRADPARPGLTGDAAGWEQIVATGCHKIPAEPKSKYLSLNPIDFGSAIRYQVTFLLWWANRPAMEPRRRSLHGGAFPVAPCSPMTGPREAACSFLWLGGDAERTSRNGASGSPVLRLPRRCYHVAHTSVPGTDSLFPERSQPERLAALIGPAPVRRLPAGTPGRPHRAQHPDRSPNGLDSGPGSLRDTIADASPGDTINFAKKVHTITLTSGELDITQNLDIEGPGPNKLTISGNDDSRVFDISAGETVTIAGLTIADGLADGNSPIIHSLGGGILNQGDLTL